MKSKNLLIFIFILSILTVIMQADQPHYYPKQKELILDPSNTLDYVQTERGIVAISNRKLVFASPDRQLIKIRKAEDDLVDSEPRLIETDGEYVYVVVLEVFPHIDYKSAEKVIKYSFEGELLEELYEKDYPESEHGNLNSIKDITVDKDSVYITEIDNETAGLIRAPKTQEESGDGENLAHFRTPEHILWGDYDAEKEVLELYNIYNEAYFYDLKEGVISYHPEIKGEVVYDCDIDITLTISRRQMLIDILYYAAIAVSMIALIWIFIRLGRSGILMSYRMAIIFVIIFAFAVGFYTDKVVKNYEEGIEEKIRYTSNSVTVGVQFFLKDAYDGQQHCWSEDMESEDIKSLTDGMRYYMNDVCKAVGSDMSIYTQIYLFGPDQEPFILFDSYEEYPAGTPYSDIVGEELPVSEYEQEGFYAFNKDKEADGIYVSIRSKLYDDEENVIGFLETGSEYGKLRVRLIEHTIEISLQMLAFVFFLYVLFDIIHKYRGEIHEFRIMRKTDPTEARILLSNTYDYIVSFLMYWTVKSLS